MPFKDFQQAALIEKNFNKNVEKLADARPLQDADSSEPLGHP